MHKFIIKGSTYIVGISKKLYGFQIFLHFNKHPAIGFS